MAYIATLIKMTLIVKCRFTERHILIDLKSRACPSGNYSSGADPLGAYPRRAYHSGAYPTGDYTSGAYPVEPTLRSLPCGAYPVEPTLWSLPCGTYPIGANNKRSYPN
jgi:hypothetical protein